MDNATGVQGSDGKFYYQLTEVCNLLKLMKKEHKEQSEK
jgi:hypothetical protein